MEDMSILSSKANDSFVEELKKVPVALVAIRGFNVTLVNVRDLTTLPDASFIFTSTSTTWLSPVTRQFAPRVFPFIDPTVDLLIEKINLY